MDGSVSTMESMAKAGAARAATGIEAAAPLTRVATKIRDFQKKIVTREKMIRRKIMKN